MESGLRTFGRDALEINWENLQKLLPTLAADFVEILETNQTNEVCDCQWIVHPDDEEKEEGTRRMRRGMPSPICPVHTREGMILGFFKWVMTGALKD